MNRKNFTTFIYLFACCFFLSCDDLSGSTSTSAAGSAEADELGRLSPKELELINTNPLIERITSGDSIENLTEHISHILEPNNLGNTAFGEAIRFRSEEDALLLLSKLQCPHLYHTNHEEESFVYLASKKGYSILIRKMAKICYESQGEEWWDWEDYEFSDLDPPTKTGDIAIHVAANTLVAEALVYEYEERGIEASPPSGWTFYDHTNHEGQTFLHKAATDGRVDIIKWATKREKCDQHHPSENDSFWETTATFGKTLWNRLQTKTWNITNLITQQDNNDNTALHLAAIAFNEEAIRAIASCPWVDYSSTNSDGDIPLQSFLKALDKSQTSHEESLKEDFKFLFQSKTTQANWIAYTGEFEVSFLTDHQNKASDSSLHIAARLADPFFYNHLKQFGDTLLKNNKEITPEQIFKGTQEKLQRSTQANDII